MYRPAAHAIAAKAPNQNASFPARGKKLCGEEYLNQFTLSLLPQVAELLPVLDGACRPFIPSKCAVPPLRPRARKPTRTRGAHQATEAAPARRAPRRPPPRLPPRCSKPEPTKAGSEGTARLLRPRGP